VSGLMITKPRVITTISCRLKPVLLKHRAFLVGPASAGKTPNLAPHNPNRKKRSKRLRESIQLV